MDSWKLAVVVGAVALGGVGLGAWLFGPQPAQAQGGRFQQCIIVRQESIDVNARGQLERFGQDRVIEIPAGWQPLGGGGLVGNWVGSMVLCR